MTEGIVVRWLKRPGEAVRLDEPVVEIETDKSTVELTAPQAGRLGPWLVAEGTTVPIGQPLVAILDAGGEATAALLVSQEVERRASPIAKKVAREHGIDLATVTGTGPGGRIVEEDVFKAVNARTGTSAELPAIPAASPSPKLEILTGARRVAAERMAHSFTTTPHFYLHVEVDATSLVDWYRRRTSAAQPSAGVALTYTDFLILFSAIALREQPRANANWQDGQVQLNPSVNIGLAVATDRGLVVPVLRGAEQLTLAEISRQRAEAIAKARAGRLLLDDFAGGTFTITNLGMFGIDSFNAILNPPQSAILAVGRIKERPWVVNGQLVARPTLHLTLSADHRVLDGAEAARFLSRIAALIEVPQELVA